MANANREDPTASMHVIVESPQFAVDAKASGLDDADGRRIVDRLAEWPAAGNLIPGTGGARKVRFAGRARARAAAIG